MLSSEAFTPEMLVYYRALPAKLQDAIAAAAETPQSMEALAALAEKWSQCGMTDL